MKERDDTVEVSATVSKSALARRIRRAAFIGIGVGVFLALLYLATFLLSEGDTAISWILLMVWPFVCGTASGFAHIFGFDLRQLFVAHPFVAWMYLTAFNGVMIGTICVLMFFIFRGTISKRSNHGAPKMDAD